MEFRLAEEKDLAPICEITDQAKQQLRALGLDQWQKGYPSKEIWEQDMVDKMCYVAVEGESILGVFAFQTIPDPSYKEINGKWLTDGAYASMHRVCVSDGHKGKGIAGAMFAYGWQLAQNTGFTAIRIDTHPGNLPMQHALGKAGFQKCGEIILAEGCEKGDLRIGFECSIKEKFGVSYET